MELYKMEEVVALYEPQFIESDSCYHGIILCITFNFMTGSNKNLK
jgi:hypothetical protein